MRDKLQPRHGRISALLAGAVTIAGCAICGPAIAQYGDNFGDKPDRRYYLSPLINYMVFDKDKDFDSSLGWGLALGKVLSRGLNVELAALVNDIQVGDGTTEGDLNGYSLTFLAFPDRNRNPFYGVVGINKLISKADGAGDDSFSDSLDFGLGYRMDFDRLPLFGKGVALRIEARYRHEKFPQAEAQRYAADFGLNEVSRSYADFLTVVGLHVPLGADPNPPPPPPEPEDDPDVGLVAESSDSDDDGVFDDQDACPATPDGMAVDADGCPIDDDSDGVLNDVDQCPNTPAGAAVLPNGCALSGDCRIPNAGEKVNAEGCAAGDAVVLKGVNFANNSSELSETAKAILDSVSEALQALDGVDIEVGGHTDSVGSDAYNLALSRRRAKAVRDYLVAQGVDGARLTAAAYGETRPLASNSSEAGRMRNRRVELKVQGE